MLICFMQWLKKFLHSFQRACPVILFFLASFLIVYKFFGLHYVMIVSIITVFFQGRYKKTNNTFLKYVRLLIVGSILLLLAFLSSKSLFWCILLNMLVPFLLVFTRSSQFNPKGYFSYAMLFVFLSLMPPEDISGLLTELFIFWFCVFILAFSIWIYFRFFSKQFDLPLTLKKSLLEISELIFLLTCPERRNELEQRFQQLIYNFHRTSYHQNFFSMRTRENQIYDMVATLLQRFSYLITDYEWNVELDSEHIATLKHLSTFLKDATIQLDSRFQEKRIETAQELLNHMTIPEGRIRIFCRSLLHMMILLLETQTSQPKPKQVINKINWRELLEQIRIRLSLESFEIRFAMRLSIVMTVSCSISYLLPITHSYWIPLNAFLLLQPSCEDSSYRMKTRPIGTLIGCCIEFLIHPFLPDIGTQLLFALVMISFMYCATPGTWYHPIFSTCYALTLATMTMNETTAIALRILYLGVAVLIVFIVNRFFFPMRKEALFKYNMKALFRLHNSYWDIIRRGLIRDTDLSVSCEILTYFHMIYEECIGYLKRNPNIPFRDDLKVVLLTLWHMFSELEQMHYLVRIKSIHTDEHKSVLKLIASIQRELYPIIDDKDFSVLKREARYQEPEVVYVLTEYLNHAESLLQYKACIPF
ncbi:Inner membrane protein YccS [Clostridiales bacterium CHKCI001]|nr:Inner membrane protein YccS [Clostridiales bacterium CHKCI001]